jgi:hypothetical protein
LSKAQTGRCIAFAQRRKPKQGAAQSAIHRSSPAQTTGSATIQTWDLGKLAAARLARIPRDQQAEALVDQIFASAAGCRAISGLGGTIHVSDIC